MAPKDSLFIFLDESGNLDFSQKGTKNYVLAAITATKPLDSSKELQTLKYSLLHDSEDIEHFHASEDKQVIRDKVFKLINNLQNIKINYIYANKRMAHPKYHNSAHFYALLGKTLLKYLLSSNAITQFAKVIIVFDKSLSKNEQKQFLKVIKPDLKSLGVPYSIYFHRTLSDFNGQIADYAAWAKYVSLERNEERPLRALSSIQINDFNIFRRGTREYY